MLFTGHLTIFAINFFIMIQIENLEEVEKTYQGTCGKISASRSLYFLRYTLWKIGFLASPETSLKQVFRVKQS
jgi:hypothetical protein